MELQFNERGRMIGCKVLNYLLDKRRVVNQQFQRKKNECNFHVFYHLLMGASSEEKSALSLTEPVNYAYTKSITTPFTAEDNIEHYESLKASMRHLGLGKRYHARIMQLIATILHLGQLQFVDDTTLQEAAYVKNTDCLELAAEFLGVDPQALENVLTYKTQMIKKDVTTMILNSEQAAIQRDDLVTILYSLLFNWLIEQMNSKLCHENIHNFIGILDLPGWAITDQATNLDKFCLNYANERVQNYILRYIFETSGAEFKADGLEYPDVDYTNNTACVDLLDQPRHGMIDIINSYSKKSSSNHALGKSSDVAMLETTIKYQTGNESFSTKKADTGANQFIIQHFSGAQLYHPEGFIESNRDALNADFVTLFRGNSDLPASNNAFLVNLFKDKSILTESHPKHADAITNAQQISKPNRKPSMRRSKSTKRKSNAAKPEEEESDTTKKKKVVPVVLAQLRSSLDELFATLDETLPWFVFCIRPNHKMTVGSAAGFDSTAVKAQVQALGLTSITKRFQTGSYGNIFLHEEFCDRYADILQSIGVEHDRLPRSKCQATVDIFGWSNTQEASIGNLKVR